MRAIAPLRYLLVLLGTVVCIGAVEVIFVHHGFENKSQHLTDLSVMRQIADTYQQLYPQRPMGQYVQGAIALKQGNHDLAAEHLRQAVSYDGTQENILYDYAVSLVKRHESADRIESAVKLWQWHYPKSTRPDPRTFASPPPVDSDRYRKGVTALRNSEFATAIACFEQDIADGIRTEQLLYNYALTLVLQNADANKIQSAVALWRRQFPDSQREDPRTAVERALQGRDLKTEPPTTR